MTTKSKSSKKGSSKASSKSTAGKHARKAVAKLTAATRIMFKSPRPKGAGNARKTQLLNLVPKKGAITFKQLAAKATKALDVTEERVNRWMASMARNGRVSLQ
jgi:hypothetical protein